MTSPGSSKQPDAPVVYTIGHSRHRLAAFVALLKKYGVKMVADARSAPYSRIAPHFNYGELEPALVKYFMYYKYMGNMIGGKPADTAYALASGGVDYEKLGASPKFVTGLDRLADLARGQATAVMCSEEDPAKCHRALLIAPGLIARGFEVRHIRGDGSAVAHEDIKPAAGGRTGPGTPPGAQLELF
jgi:uncharacterized protein (DUF488 family)